MRYAFVALLFGGCIGANGADCNLRHGCDDCLAASGCGWCDNVCVSGTSLGANAYPCRSYHFDTCGSAGNCGLAPTCGACLGSGCSWCDQTHGVCTDDPSECPASQFHSSMCPSTPVLLCSEYGDCATCAADRGCMWLNASGTSAYCDARSCDGSAGSCVDRNGC